MTSLSPDVDPFDPVGRARGQRRESWHYGSLRRPEPSPSKAPRYVPTDVFIWDTVIPGVISFAAMGFNAIVAVFARAFCGLLNLVEKSWTAWRGGR